MLGVGLNTLTCVAWKWRAMLRGHGKCVRHPGGGRSNIYPLAEIERIRQAQAAAADKGLAIPPGFVDRDGACRIFGVTRCVWKRFIREGKVPFGRMVSSSLGGKQKIYSIEDIHRLKEELFGADKLYKSADGHYHVPAEFVRREEAWERFGVSKPTWERWEREGRITCGSRVPGGPKLYKVEDIGRMLDEYGRYCPPYPDPQRPGAYRVPLSGRDIRRREAIIDAESLPLIEGGTCSWSQTGDFRHVSFCSRDGEHVPLRRVIVRATASDRQVGHRNGDPLDCRRANLVVRTVSERNQTQRKRKTIAGRPPTSRFKGVYWETWTKKWRAAISVNGKSHRLGRFGDEIAAAEAYDDAARKWFGEHARLNFPDGADAFLNAEWAATTAARAA